MKILLLALLPLGVTAEEPPPSLVFLEYLGLSQELAEIGIDVDDFNSNEPGNEKPDSAVEPEQSDTPDSSNKLREKS